MNARTPAAVEIRRLDVTSEAVWHWETSTPRWSPGRFGHPTTFDPFPAYPHDLDTVRRTVEHVTSVFPPLWPITLYVADREEVGRSNGFSNVFEDGHYEGDEWVKDPTEGVIVLSGKRVPPHPAMTRYLVAHEYGHHVQWMLNQAGSGDDRSVHDDHGHMTAYAKLRGLPDSVHHGTGGRWHDSIREIFACDFRIMMACTEVEFWPHPGIARPEDVPGLAAWWSGRYEVLTGAVVELGGRTR